MPRLLVQYPQPLIGHNTQLLHHYSPCCLEPTLSLASVLASVAGASTDPVLGAASAEINPQLATINLSPHKSFSALGGALHINKVSVGETSWLASTSVNRNPDIDDISNITEELVEISVGHLEGKVANEQSL